MNLDLDIPVLSQGFVDRSEDLRDPQRIISAWATARILVVGADGEFPIVDSAAGAELRLVPAPDFGSAPPKGAVFVGNIANVDHWALTGVAASVPGASTVANIRSVGALLPAAQAALATTAVALLRWHAEASFCARCGGPTAADLTGHSRRCERGHQEFPRTDPAVIVLVHDGADRVVLARQPSWEAGRFSVLAGFAEAGESLEATVAREVREEVGVRVSDIAYLGSQPWPFPRSLMVAFAAQAPSGAQLAPRAGEIADARWFSRGELRRVLSGASEGNPQLILPGSISIARRMVEAFVRAG